MRDRFLVIGQCGGERKAWLAAPAAARQPKVRLYVWSNYELGLRTDFCPDCIIVSNSNLTLG